MSAISLVLLLPICLIVGVMRWRRGGVPLPTTAPRAGLATRGVEALALAALGSIFLVLLAIGREMPSELDQVYPALAKAYLFAAGCAAAGALLAVVAALLWRTWAGGLIMVAVIVAYGYAGEHQLLWFAPPGAADVVNFYTIGENDEYTGVNLWVNGVYLGPTPVTMTINQFLAKVPYWPEAPNGFTEREFMGSKNRDLPKPWFRFALPRYLKQRNPQQWSDSDRYYYGQIELDGEWGIGDVGSSGGSTNGQVTRQASDVSMEFPKRDGRIKAHLEQARQTNYVVDDAWWQTMEAYSRSACRVRRKEMERDPELGRMMTAWASRRYDLGKVGDARSAADMLQRICAEADELGWYDTTSVAGAAVEWLVPYLDPEQLVEAAGGLLAQSYSGYRVRRSASSDKFYFSTRVRDGDRNENRWPPSAFTVAHAVWKMDQRLDAEDDTTANVIETRVLPELVYRYGSHQGKLNRPLEIATAMGWPGAYRFLVRHDWRREVHTWQDDSAKYVGQDTFVNVWLHLLLCLNTDDGRAFRLKYKHRLQDTATQIVRGANGDVNLKHLRFMFLDMELGDKSPAMLYWKQFVSLTRDKGFWGLKNRFDYLACMEPVPPAQMYVDAWAAATENPSVSPMYDLRLLPAEKHLAVLEAWISRIETIIADPTQASQPWMKPTTLNDEVLPQLKRQLQQVQRELANSN